MSPWLLTWLAKIFLLFIRILTFWNRKYNYYCLYFSFITLYPSFITFLWQVFCGHFNCTILLFRKWIKKSCVLCRNFISIYRINRTFTWPLGDTNFIFECWKYFSLVRLAHSWEILSALEDKIRIPAQPCNILYIQRISIGETNYAILRIIYRKSTSG